MPIPKTPTFLLKKIEACRAQQEKTLSLKEGDKFNNFRLLHIPPEVFTLTHLEHLDLCDNAIQIVPDEIKQLTQLKRLDLRGNPLSRVADIAGLVVHYADFQRLNIPAKNILGLKLTLFSYDPPTGIFACPNLIALEIRNHRLTQIPDWVFKLVNLTELNLSNNKLQNLSGLETLRNLSTLDLRDNRLTSLLGLETLRNLSALDLRGNQLTSLSGLETLANLSALDLRGNQLTSLSGLETLANLSALDLRSNRLTSLSGLETLANLSTLDLSFNQLTSLSGLETLVYLSSLDLSGNPLTSLSGLETLANLSTLDLSFNQLTSLSGLETLANLSSLHLSHNKLTSLSGLETLTNLSALDLSFNELTSLSGLEMLGYLSSLDLSRNDLTSLSGLETLANLSSLDLSRNDLISLSGLETLANLSSLDLSYNQLTSLSGLETLANLSFLNLSNNDLTSLSGLETLGNLSTLYLSGNQLTSLSGLETLGNLSSLNLSRNQLTSLSGLETLANLSFLNLSRNQLTSLSGLETLANLSFLNLSNNDLTSLSGLKTLAYLSSLDLSENQLASLSGLETLANLSFLNLSNNDLTSLSGLETLAYLSTLDLSENPLTSLSGLEMLANLSSLYLRDNQLTSLSGLETLANLSALDLRSNQLTSLLGLETLANLSALDLRSNQLTSLLGLETLANLSALDLRSNQLTSLSGLETLGNLSSLDLSYNQLTSLSGLGTLVNLSALNLSYNQLTSLSGLETLANLSTLDLSHNQSLHELPDNLFFLQKLEALQLEGTVLTYPPIEQLELGREGDANLFRVRNYLRQLAQGEQDYLYEAKLLIVGEGGAGKTTLANKIKDKTYQVPDSHVGSTEGIDVMTWYFAYNQEHQYRVNIWDFGGQEIYHATHQFFLTKRALYLLVADNRREDTDFYYWLNVVETLSDSSPILLIKNEKDDRQREINEPALKAQFANFKDSYATNLKTNSKDFSRFLEGLEHHLKQLRHIGMPLPKTWLDVRAELEKLSKTGNYIFLQEYLAICERYGFKNSGDKLQLSETLHELGVILHFQQDPLLRKTLFLNPAWATQAVYHVLDNKTVQNNYGKFTKDDLDQIWHESQYEGMHDDLLQLMLNFKLCYPLTYCQKTYIAPQLLGETQPDYQFDTQNTVTVYYKNYTFMPKGMLSQLIVILHKVIAEKQTLVWRSGVVLKKQETQAEIIEKYGNREISIRVAGRNRRDLLTEVMLELDKIHESYHKHLIYEVELPCSCAEPYYFNFKTLKDFAVDHAKIQCQKRSCRQMLDARDLLEGILNMKEETGKTSFSNISIGSVLEGILNMKEETGKTSFSNISIGSVAGDVSFNQADRDIVKNNDNRSINVSGNGNVVGDNATIYHTETHNTLNQGMQADLKSLREILLKIELGEDKAKVEKLLTTAENEVKKPEPDKEEVGSALDRVFKLVKKSGKLIGAVRTDLVPIAKNVGEWLGEHGGELSDFFQ
ncbi:leucine-rich repeat domain-containing protein [Beggiatoa leptomitoformis]|uniref:non-specific serine/threonine protein kinase n=1 Tax=Beggiatoa leptomitoformis TaxID=288004 RepID=A0A2N9YC09_9GAMM|nr:leucine-rich repeat domain-containing protein [Beggiatoa leptomitoformis]AUI68027.1 hypothetical protein BLE401_04470 [Beggiatoa leptomitoformis]QGX03465.1 hypothetical protein AL038_18285 [Beggiatoa leptomitoformis]